MRTDVKVGLVCVLALVIAVIGYFALQNKPREAAGRGMGAGSATAEPGGSHDKAGAGRAVAAGSAGASVSPAGNSGTPLALYSPEPGLGQTPPVYSPSNTSTTGPSGGSTLYPPGGGPGSLLPAVGGGSTGLTTGAGEASPPSVGPGSSGGAVPSLGGSRPGEIEPGMRPGEGVLEPGTPRMPAPGHSGPGLTHDMPAPGATAAAGTYTVQNGDSLSSIAKKNHVSLKALEAANPSITPPYNLKLKQPINIPAAGAAPAGGAAVAGGAAAGRAHGAATRPAAAGYSAATRPAVAAGSSYKVKKGDTLRKISKTAYGDEKFWRSIFRANRSKLDDADDLEPGMVLRIPAK